MLTSVRQNVEELKFSARANVVVVRNLYVDVLRS